MTANSNYDNRRNKIRNQYREAMARRTEKSPTNKDILYVPPMHFSQEEIPDLSFGHSWLYNGFTISIDGVAIVIDPGLDFLFRLARDNYDLAAIDYIFISHAHIDHYAGAAPLLDWLIRAQSKVITIAPEEVFHSVISPFHAGTDTTLSWSPNHSSIAIEDNQVLKLINNIELQPLKLQHGTPCFGFKLKTKQRTITYISDTGHFAGIKEYIADSTILVINIDSFAETKNSKTHLSAEDLLKCIPSKNDLQHIVVTHVNPSGELPFEEWGKQIAAYIEHTTNIPTVCPDESGLRLDI